MATGRNIVAGPSKFDLMVSLLDGADSDPVPGNRRRLVTFGLEPSRDSRVKAGDSLKQVWIQSLQREDGSGQIWNFTAALVESYPTKFVKGWYSTSDRRGYMEEIS